MQAYTAGHSGEFGSLSEQQVDALCNVAFGGHGAGVSPRTLKSLERRGLIASVPVHKREGNVLFSLLVWEMPLGVHIAFCDWCSSTPLLDLQVEQ